MFEESLNSRIFRPRAFLMISRVLFRIEGLRIRDGFCGNPCRVFEEADVTGRVPSNLPCFGCFGYGGGGLGRQGFVVALDAQAKDSGEPIYRQSLPTSIAPKRRWSD